MMHIPFFAEKKDCDVSIRSSWWSSQSLTSSSFFIPFFGLEVEEDNWDDFIQALVEFAKEEVREQVS